MAYLTYKGKNYNVVDALEYITLADSFLKNKIGSGHGEAKLYVGNESERLFDFFGDFELNCIFKKSDFERYLEDVEDEFKYPEQDYVKKEEMPTLYDTYKFALDQIHDEILPFSLYRTSVEPPRVYLNCHKNNYYELMRSLGLPNLSYLSVLKLKEEESNEFLYYFKMFVDYNTDLIRYVYRKEEVQEQIIKNNTATSEKQKNELIKAKDGQGDFRTSLLKECNCCPFTLVTDERLLVATHIKPWYASDDKEKVDPKNGFIFTPTFERLFTRGFITFENDKTLSVSPWISPSNQKKLGIYNGKLIDSLPIDDKRKAYLEFHRDFIFKF